MLERLQLHPQSSCKSVKWITAEIERPGGSSLKLHYKLAGAIGEIAIPERSKAGRTDGLWQHSCFELFVGLPSGAGYLEFNFSPSTQWAAYAFSGYREAMRDADLPCAPTVRFVSSGQGLALMAEIEGLPDAALPIGLSAVIEEIGGAKSYWALRHPPGKPDFHHPDCFALELPPPSQP